MEPISVGIDFGAKGLRVAFAAEAAGFVSVEHGLAPNVAWLRCERSPSGPGVSFPSLKSMLVPTSLVRDEGDRWASQQLTEALAGAKQSVEGQTGRPVRRATACVPARYPSQPRAAFHEAALAAGFAEVDLITDSVGAVLAHTAVRPPPATVLVFGAGYESVELGLVRAVKGHLRVLAYESAVTAGATLDDMVIAGWAKALGPMMSRARWNASQWMMVRNAAETVKQELGAADQVVFPIDVADRSGTAPQVGFLRYDFEDAVKQVFGPVVGLLKPLLAKADMPPTEIDEVVLVGGTTRIPMLRALLLEALGHKPIMAAPGALAFGAALHASRLGSKLAEISFQFEGKPENISRGAHAGDGASLRATAVVTGAQPDHATVSRATLIADETAGAGELLASGALERFVAALVKAGEVDRARAELENLIRQAQTALDDLPVAQADADTSPTSPTYRSRLALANARACLERRQFARAVSESHHAWKMLPDDPEILDQMIVIHCEAAMANGAFDQYKDAIRWLMCAFGHDESNARTRSLLARRHYVHARELLDRSRPKEALEAVEHCFTWDPEHADAVELHRTLVSD